ncbi:MAG: thiolase family protein [Lautropia sp.]
MTMGENRIKDRIAIVGVGSAGYRRDAGGLSGRGLAYQACVRALSDANLSHGDVDGVCASSVWDNTYDRTVVDIRPRAHQLAAALGLSEVTHFSNVSPVIGFHLADAANAIFAGDCETVLLSHTVFRAPQHSRQAMSDPFRRGLVTNDMMAGVRIPPEDVSGPVGYTIWASHYLDRYPVTREHLGMIAINGRTNAGRNPEAVYRKPLTMEEYLAAPLVRDPLCKFDMDVPVDASDAFVVTSVERARDMCERPVVVHAMAQGLVPINEEDQLPNLDHHGHHVVVKQLRRKSDFWIDDVDVAMLYDGFSNITLSWIENLGWCERGEAGHFVEANWSSSENRILIRGRVPVNTNGGSLSEGGTQGSGHLREAVLQLRGAAGERQVPGARRVLAAIGGYFFNAQGVLLRNDA